jgi:hypothetical protein
MESNNLVGKVDDKNGFLSMIFIIFLYLSFVICLSVVSGLLQLIFLVTKDRKSKR